MFYCVGDSFIIDEGSSSCASCTCDDEDGGIGCVSCNPPLIAVEEDETKDTTSSAVVGVSTSFLMLAASAGSIIGAFVLII